MNRIYAIVNPKSGNGRTKKTWPKAYPLLRKHFGDIPWEWTHEPGEATKLAGDALRQGNDIILSVGGDGTHHEAANAFFGPKGPLYPKAALATLPMGTGSDLGKTLDIPNKTAAAVEAIAERRTALIDAGWLHYRDNEGNDREKGFVNVFSFGMSGDVDRRLHRSSKVFGGFLSFLWASVLTILSYRSKAVRYSIDGEPWVEEDVLLIAAANGGYFGGGMWVAPMAKPDDGVLNVVVVRKLSLLRQLRDIFKLYSGAHLSLPEVDVYPARSLRAESPEKVLIDVDGEPLGRLPFELNIVPGALNVIVGSDFHKRKG